MNFVLRPWQLLLLILAGWINRDQQDTIEYLLTENQVLREKLGKGRILLNDDQRRRWAVKGKVLGRKSLGKLAKIVRPDTLLRWHRELIARKWDHSDKRQYVGRPRIRQPPSQHMPTRPIHDRHQVKGLSNRFSVISCRACREGFLHLCFPAGQVQVLPAG